MKIVHICVCGPYTDDWNYQENVLTKYHVKQGHEVTLIASQWAWGKNGSIVNICDSEYINNDGVKVIRLPIRDGKDVFYRYKRFEGLGNSLVLEKPDFIFIHNLQFYDLDQIAKYAKNHNVRIVADNHADYSNSARTFMAKVFYRTVWRCFAKKIEPYVEKFYGVLPSRVEFLIKEYKLPREKCELLVMGADDEYVAKTVDKEFKKIIRKTYGIQENDFLIVTGGKIDKFKTQTILLMQAIRKSKNKNVKMILFGSIDKELQQQVDDLVDGSTIQNIGWITAEDSYQYFAAADLVVFPGRHSVFWEQVVGMGIPMVCKYWEGTTHVDVGGNVIFLDECSVEEMQGIIDRLSSDYSEYEKMLISAQTKGKSLFSYSVIAKKVVS